MAKAATKPFSSQDFKKIYSLVPRLTAEIVLQTPKGIILSLRKLKSWKNQWHIPGGTIYYRETLAQAVNRVAYEELGVRVKIIKFIGHIEYPSEQKERGFGHTIGLAFLCKIRSGKLLPNDEAEKIRPFKTLPKKIIGEQRTFFKKYFPGKIA